MIIDLAKDTTWRGLHPGMPRAEGLRVLESNGAEVSEDDTDPGWMGVTWEDSGLELIFAEEGDQALRQIVLEEEESTWAGKALIDQRLDRVMAAMGDAATGAAWRPECAYDERFADLEPPPPGPFADEVLLNGGTLWLPKLRLGLVVCEGNVFSIIWRRPEDFPIQLVGPFSEGQKRIMERPDYGDYVRESASDKLAEDEAPSGSGLPQKLLMVAFIAVLAWLGSKAFQESRRWHTAPEIDGKLTEIVDTPNALVKKHYRVSFADNEGRTHFADLEPGEFYIAPSTVGEDVKLAYVAGDPPRVMGLSRVRDAAFIRYVPWFIGVTAGYVILCLALHFLMRQRRAQESMIVTPVLPTNSGNG
ncbi:MAG TPA: hypothetical protein VFG14_01700 [Chthoniobacteraceae bacterium]|nr:hypothetical protein [Chthoniobacteraceae bacterium]